jgi:hypothetical protein
LLHQLAVLAVYRNGKRLRLESDLKAADADRSAAFKFPEAKLFIRCERYEDGRRSAWFRLPVFIQWCKLEAHGAFAYLADGQFCGFSTEAKGGGDAIAKPENARRQ